MSQRRQEHRRKLVTDARAVAGTCAGINIRLAERRITHFLEQHLHETGLSVSQFGLMIHVAAAGDDTIGALAARLGLDQSTLSRNLRALERDGLVEIAAVEQDLRRRAVWLTEHGARRLEQALPAWKRAHVALARMVDSRAVRRLAASAGALAGACPGRGGV